MRTIEETTAFRRDLRKALGSPRHRDLGKLFDPVLRALVRDDPLHERYRDRKLGGRWVGYRECHIKPDLLLIYRKPEGVLVPIRLGTHSELFGK